MAKEKDENVVVSASTLANAIVEATELATGTRRKIPFGQHIPKTAFNPTGKTRTVRKVFYQNGFKIADPNGNDPTLTDKEIELLHKIKPGRYIDNLVTVREREIPGAPTEVHIGYHNKTADQRMALGSRIGGVTSKSGRTVLQNMLEMMIAEYDEQQAALKAQRKREIEEAMADPE